MHHDIQIASSTYDPETPGEATFLVSYTDEGHLIRVPAAGIDGLLMVVAKILDPRGLDARGAVINAEGEVTNIGNPQGDDLKSLL